MMENKRCLEKRFYNLKSPISAFNAFLQLNAADREGGCILDIRDAERTLTWR